MGTRLFVAGLPYEVKDDQFQDYFNSHRAHMGLNGKIPCEIAENDKTNIIDINKIFL